MISERLKHKNIYEDKSRIAVRFPLVPELQEIHENGYFPLLEDPKKTGKTTFIGMFVLRPSKEAWNSPIIQNGSPSLFDIKEWTYNIKGLDGGWMIANKNPMDAYRLALQYALSDAVIVGSTTAAVEGTPHNDQEGYVWHPYNPVSWSQVVNEDPDLLTKIMKQREELQKAGYLSDRKYPAQIVVTQSGNPTNPRDILEAKIFHSTDPDGNPIEAYILTSETGAGRIRERAERFGLEDRMKDILIILSPDGNPDVIDLQRLPEVLYGEPYNIIIANHDGGATVLSEFAKAGILSQMNLTLTRKYSLEQVLRKVNDPRVPESVKQEVLANFSERTDKFFSTEKGEIPQELVPVSIIADNIDEATVVTFDSRALAGKGFR